MTGRPPARIRRARSAASGRSPGPNRAVSRAPASPEVELKLVTTVHGNVELAQTTENALRVLHLAGRADVPVAAGARSALVHPLPERAGHVHGSAGLGGVELPPSPAPLDPRPAVVALADLLLSP